MAEAEYGLHKRLGPKPRAETPENLKLIEENLFSVLFDAKRITIPDFMQMYVDAEKEFFYQLDGTLSPITMEKMNQRDFSRRFGRCEIKFRLILIYLDVLGYRMVVVPKEASVSVEDCKSEKKIFIRKASPPHLDNTIQIFASDTLTGEIFVNDITKGANAQTKFRRNPRIDNETSTQLLLQAQRNFFKTEKSKQGIEVPALPPVQGEPTKPCRSRTVGRGNELRLVEDQIFRNLLHAQKTNYKELWNRFNTTYVGEQRITYASFSNWFKSSGLKLQMIVELLNCLDSRLAVVPKYASVVISISNEDHKITELKMPPPNENNMQIFLTEQEREESYSNFSCRRMTVIDVNIGNSPLILRKSPPKKK